MHEDFQMELLTLTKGSRRKKNNENHYLI